MKIIVTVSTTGTLKGKLPEYDVVLKGEVVQVAVDAHQLTILEDRLPKKEESSFQKKKNAKVKEK